VAKWENKDGGLLKVFKLVTTCSTSNFVLFDENYKLARFQSANEIMERFYRVRLNLYDKRKKYMAS